MTSPKIVAHMAVENEIRWAWFALRSVLDYVDEILIWDLGSTDGTAEVLKSVSDPKIRFHSHPGGGGLNLTDTRQRMLAQTRGDWLFLVDGDEIWPSQAISHSSSAIRSQGQNLDYLVHTYYNLVGDIYHYQEPGGGRYHLAGKTGHYTVRAVNLKRVPGVHFARPHGQQGIFDASDTLIQDRPGAAYLDIPERYLHTTHLRRSLDVTSDASVHKRTQKFKYELGLPLLDNFIYPACFYFPRPVNLPSPWEHRTLPYVLNAAWQTPVKFLHRRLVTSARSGY